MTILTIDQFWNPDNWLQTTTGGGAVTVDATKGTVKCKSTVANDRSYVTYNQLLFGGDTVEFEVFARSLSGDVDTALISINSPFGGATASSAGVWQEDWRLYKVRYTLPTDIPARGMSILLGNVTSTEEIEFARPKLRLINGNVGAARVIACGVFRIDGATGLLTQRSEYQSFGIDLANSAWNATDKSVDFQLSQTIDWNDQGVARYRPTAQIATAYVTTKNLDFKIGEFDDSGGFKVRAIDYTTGNLFDIVGGGSEAYDLHLAVYMP